MSFIYFDSRNPLYKSHFGAIPEGQKVKFRLRLEENCGVWYAYMLLRRDGESQDLRIKMEYEYKEEGALYYSTEIDLKEGLYWYSFLYETENNNSYINRGQHSLGTKSGGEKWQLTVYNHNYTTPNWLKGGIIYQIFPDRFYKAGTLKQKHFPNRCIRSNWGEKPFYRWKYGETEVLGNDFFGGNLKGITKKLPYLKELGISCIYLNPIFYSVSNHRYNTADYEKIDPMLGTESDFKKLCEEAKKLDIHIILDGVFSHTGDDSKYFNRYGRFGNNGAAQSKSSPYFSWYKFKNWPKDYHSWWGIDTLPEVKEEDPKFLEYICGENGIARRWLRAGADGWRLDVADELPDVFLDTLRNAVKAEKSDAFILGEVWEDATNKVSYNTRRRYLLGQQLDSVMNYPFSNAIINFVKWGNGEEFAEKILEVCENYPAPALHLLMNHIGTHDTPRILTLLGSNSTDSGDREQQAHSRLNIAEYLTGVKKLMCAAILQYTLPGVPSLYYGDEAGMEGYGDPFCRGCYPWGQENAELLHFYKELGKIRLTLPPLTDGSIYFVAARNGLVEYTRENALGKILVAVNTSEQPQQIYLPKDFEGVSPIFSNCETTPTTLPPFGYAVFSI